MMKGAWETGPSGIGMNDKTETLFGLTDPIPREGRHSGYVRIPFSSDTSAYGFIPVPIVVVGGGEGPTLLLVAGTFGDELESQVAAARLARMLDPAKLAGRVIVLPMANAPACEAGTRNSPIDGRNLNRSFPGNVFGTPTSIIADYIERQLMPVSDIVVDLHSDGRSIRYVPSVTLIHHADPDIRSRRLAAAIAFGAPNVLIFHSFEDRNTSGAARRAGAVRIATEIGGPDPVGTSVDGLLRLLKWAGIVREPTQPAPPANRYVVRQDSDFIYGLHHGIFEPACPLGQAVHAGAIAGEIHDLMRPLALPVPVPFPIAGTVVCTRGAGIASPGDCLMHLGTPLDDALEAECREAAGLRWLPTQVARAAGQPRIRRRKETP
jgi:predicted deacylase